MIKETFYIYDTKVNNPNTITKINYDYFLHSLMIFSELWYHFCVILVFHLLLISPIKNCPIHMQDKNSALCDNILGLLVRLSSFAPLVASMLFFWDSFFFLPTVKRGRFVTLYQWRGKHHLCIMKCVQVVRLQGPKLIKTKND